MSKRSSSASSSTTLLVFVLSSVSLFALFFSLFLSNAALLNSDDFRLILNPYLNKAVTVNEPIMRHVSSLNQDSIIESHYVLLPDWIVLVIVKTTPFFHKQKNYTCLYPNGDTSHATFSGTLPSTNQTTFKCDLPLRLRRRMPFPSPVFITSNIKTPPSSVVVAVTPDSVQEVIRCPHPNLTDVDVNKPIQVSIEITQENRVVPSVARYYSRRKIASSPPQQKSLICACTMVYNVAKFLREWVVYHSTIGVEKFILYDNDSDDDLASVVKVLNEEGYVIETVFWIWPKTQEAGFSHGAVYSKHLCTWMMYVDVDEFVFSPKWLNESEPSSSMIKSLLPIKDDDHGHQKVGQVSIKCKDFGPSGQVTHPVDGVTQGYDCRQKLDQRHKSIVLLEAIDDSLINVVHHFSLNWTTYKSNHVELETAVVNHYKYQAWPEFKTKFRRRVSAYVVDWQNSVNPHSKDRTPGLGFQAVEPEGWADKFCEVRDDRLRILTEKWLRVKTPTGYQMAWQ
ncbi:hypothetical protein ACFE04_013749 [Oxalis oulophora]